MSRPHLALVVLLIFCLGLFGGITSGVSDHVDQQMSVVQEANTSEYLVASSIDQTGQHSASIDVAGAVGSNAGEVRETYFLVSVQREYREALTDPEKRMVIRESTRQTSERIDELEAHERAAIERYNDGDIGEAQLLRILATVDRQSRAIENVVNWLEPRANMLGMDDFSDNLSADRVRLTPLQGPVRNSVDESLQGDVQHRIHVETSGSSLVLASVAVDETNDATYVREAHDPSAKTVNIEDRYGGSISPAEERIEELYPWVTTTGVVSVDSLGPANARVYRFSYRHPHGQLNTYLDSGSEGILRETQFKDLSAVPTTTSTFEADDLRLQVATTRPGGPLGMTVNDTTTEERVGADIEVNGRPVGTTDEGRLWTVAPRGELVINATHDGRTVSFETRVE